MELEELLKMEIDELTKKIQLPLDLWPANCCDVCIHFLKKLDLNGELQDGYFIGNIHPNSIFLGNGPIQKLRHCWIKLNDDSIIDPTRWTITCENPYIYYTTQTNEYIDGQNLGFGFYGVF